MLDGLARFLFVFIWCCCLCLLLVIVSWCFVSVVDCGIVVLVVEVLVRGVCVSPSCVMLFWLRDLGIFCKMVGFLCVFVVGLLVGLAVVLCFDSIGAPLIVLCMASLGGLRLYLLFSAFYVVSFVDYDLCYCV